MPSSVDSVELDEAPVALVSEPENLVRALRRRDLYGILINTMIGSGMLAAPAKVFGLIHGWSFAALALGAALITPLILCFADLGGRFTETGGPYLYVRRTLPGWLAFCAGWSLWVSQCFSTAVLARLSVSYLGVWLPTLDSAGPRSLAIAILGLLLTSMTLRGVRASAVASTALIVPKLIFIVGFIALGIGAVSLQRLTPPPVAPGAGALAQAILVYIFAYTGFERAGVLAGEARTPRRDLPWALIAGLGTATLAYGGILLVCLGVLPDPARTDRPFAEVGRQLLGPAGGAVVSVGALVIVLGVIIVGVFATPRMLLALSEQGQLPRHLGAIHPRWRTPHVAILVSSTVSFSLAMFEDLLGALTFSTLARVLCYTLCCAALWRLSSRAGMDDRAFRLPAPRLFAGLSILLLVAVAGLGAIKEMPALAAVIAVGFCFYGWTRWRYRSHSAAPGAGPSR